MVRTPSKSWNKAQGRQAAVQLWHARLSCESSGALSPSTENLAMQMSRHGVIRGDVLIRAAVMSLARLLKRYYNKEVELCAPLFKSVDLGASQTSDHVGGPTHRAHG